MSRFSPQSPVAPVAHFAAIESIALFLGVALTAIALLPRFAAFHGSVLYGVLLAWGNARSLRFFGEKLAAKRSVGLLIVLVQLKLALIAVFLYVGIRFLSLHGVALCVGLSVLPLSIVARAVLFARGCPRENG